LGSGLISPRQSSDQEALPFQERLMQTRIFPAIGQPVSEIGLGTWQLGGTEWGEVSDEQAFATLSAAADAGVNFLDTADIYGGGRSEQLIGKFLQQRGQRDQFFLATKLGRRPDPGWPENFSRAAVIRHTEDSLRRLGVERIDLTQTHCLPEAQLADGVLWETLRELQRAGKVRAFGASVETVEEGLNCLNIPGLSSLQIIFNVFRQKPLAQLLRAAAAQGVAIIVRLPLASGLLSGRLSSHTQFAPTDHRTFNRDGQKFNVGETFAGLELTRGLALVEDLRPFVPAGWTMSQWALRWCLDWPEVTTLIPGAKRPEQARENAAASDLAALPKADHERLQTWYREHVAAHIRGKY
jgi:aryl-alcohol dehydrogenase-like predicted oxidoreductase